MRKLAIFVEGLTELGFIERLISEIAGTHNIVFEKKRIVGGATAPRQVISLEAARTSGTQKFYVLLYDCGGDHQVKPRIVEQHQSLSKSGFCSIIGLRDVRPNTSREDIPLLERNLKYGIKTSLIPVEIFLAVMEIEAWFLAESSHFEKIDPGISLARIEIALGFNPASGDMALRDEPTLDLDGVYLLGGKRYQKPGLATIQALDYSRMYLELADKIVHFGNLVKSIDGFLTNGTEVHKAIALS